MDEKNDGDVHRHSPARQPVVLPASSVIGGILLDRLVPQAPVIWALTGITAAVWWFAPKRGGRRAGLLICVLWACVGGMRHHLAWFCVSREHVVRLAAAEPAPIDVIGTIASRPAIRRATSARTAVPSVDRTFGDLVVSHVVDRTGRRRASGRVRLLVSGHLPRIETGDVVRVRGHISRPRGPGNVREFDYRSHLRRRAIHCVVVAEDPLAVEILHDASWRQLCWWTARARRIADDVLFRFLSADTYPLASALLLGNRDFLSPNLRDAFAESGTLHLLAISGLHVGILAAFLCRVARISGLACSRQVWLVVSALAVYVLITGGRPSILRAAVLFGALMTARLWYRPATAVNTLAAAGLVVLLWNPADLFDVGAQLSFLAVMAITWAGLGRSHSKSDPAELLSTRTRAVCVRVLRRLTADYRVMLAILLFTSPLIAWSFNLYAPLGLLVNVLLIRLVAGVLVAGYATLVLGFLVPLAAPVPAWLFDFGLRGLQAIAICGARMPGGHRYGPGPSLAWVCVFYALLAVLVLGTKRARRRVQVALLAWMLCGLMSGLKTADGTLRCTFLDVGHGAAVLVETPAGKTLLVDLGSMRAPDRAVRAVRGYLWERGHTHLDGLAITHADMDHFNGVNKVLNQTRVGSLLVTSPFLQAPGQAIDELLATARTRQVPVALIGAGDRLLLDDAVRIRVLHPSLRIPVEDLEDRNASSLVLQVEFAGRTILLTGDISGSGLERLLSGPPRRADVLMSPHHGSRHDNPPRLANWTRPDSVIASSGRESVDETLRRVYSESRVLVTARVGAVTCVIDKAGRVTVRGYRGAADR